MGRKHWLWTVAVAVVVACIAAVTVWAVRQHAATAASEQDCAVVAELAQEWVADPANAARDAAGGNPFAEADSVAELSDKVRAAVDSVSTPTLKKQLTNWADGFDLTAQVIRDDLRHDTRIGEPSADEFERIRAAGDLVYSTADELRAECPDAWPPQHGDEGHR